MRYEKEPVAPLECPETKHLVFVYVERLLNERKEIFRHHKEAIIRSHPVEFFAALGKDKYHIV